MKKIQIGLIALITSCSAAPRDDFKSRDDAELSKGVEDPGSEHVLGEVDLLCVGAACVPLDDREDDSTCLVDDDCQMQVGGSWVPNPDATCARSCCLNSVQALGCEPTHIQGQSCTRDRMCVKGLCCYQGTCDSDPAHCGG